MNRLHYKQLIAQNLILNCSIAREQSHKYQAIRQ